MGKRLRQQVIKVKNYGDDSINRFAVVLVTLEKMDERERQAAINFIIAKWQPTK